MRGKALFFLALVFSVLIAAPALLTLPSLASRTPLLLAGPATLDPVGDAYVSEVQPATNLGDATKLSVQNADGELADDRRSYLGFDLSAIPGEATITGAALKAYLYEAQGLATVKIEVRRVTSPWAAGTVTWERSRPPTPSANCSWTANSA